MGRELTSTATLCRTYDLGIAEYDKSLQLLGHDIALKDVTSCMLEQCAEVFNIGIKQESVKELNSYYVR